ncbi:predicted protein [Botrytis cinerea T4]|uniref:Uncharacterized protein n=1 Tax=Botryotinia fuckeliana (strain T4) TaxID=999810 RepID=G2YRW1_BOTF4|nr:predicted protein [Botrytis cinerea T4]
MYFQCHKNFAFSPKGQCSRPIRRQFDAVSIVQGRETSLHTPCMAPLRFSKLYPKISYADWHLLGTF